MKIVNKALIVIITVIGFYAVFAISLDIITIYDEILDFNTEFFPIIFFPATEPCF